MNCPRCAVAMKRVEVEAVEVDLCPRCHGSWYDQIELSKMFAIPDAKMAATPLASPEFPRVDLDKTIACPKCGRDMERAPYLKGSQVLVDRCEEHGVWLDGGELKSLLDHMAEKVDSLEAHATGFFQGVRRLFGL